jgi:hypothetical protein
MPYVTGSEILAHVRKSDPEADDTAWAATVAARLEAVIAHRMEGVTVDPGSDAEAELIGAALQDGAAEYIARKAPHGVIVVGPGDATRLGADIVRSLEPVFRRYALPGIA